MAVYPLSVNDVANFLQSILSGLNASGILTTNHYLSSDSLIVTTNVSNKVIKFYMTSIGSNSMQIFIGDAYVSGSTITNPLTLMADSNITTSGGAVMVIIPGTMAIVMKQGTYTYVSGVIFTSRGNGNKLVFSYTNSAYIPTICRDTTSGMTGGVTSFLPPLISVNSKYYQHPFFYHLGGVGYSDILHINTVLKAQTPTGPLFETFGNDILLNTTQVVNGISSLYGMLLIKNGAL